MPEIQAKNLHREAQKVESFGGKAEFVDVSPEHLMSEVPVLVAGGWTIGIRSSKEVGHEINNHGRRALMVNHARFGEVPDRDYPKEVLHNANTLLRVLDAAGVDKTDVIAHSKGTLDAVVAASMQPERFRSLILVTPAGMIGEDTVKRLGRGFARKMGRSITRDLVENPKEAATIINAATPFIAKNLRKSASEVKTIASTTVDQALYDLRQAGINIAVIQSNADPVFRPERIKEQVNLDEQTGNVDVYASAAWKKAGHDDLLIHPERTARAALQMIEQFEGGFVIKDTGAKDVHTNLGFDSGASISEPIQHSTPVERTDYSGIREDSDRIIREARRK